MKQIRREVTQEKSSSLRIRHQMSHQGQKLAVVFVVRKSLSKVLKAQVRKLCFVRANVKAGYIGSVLV